MTKWKVLTRLDQSTVNGLVVFFAVAIGIASFIAAMVSLHAYVHAPWHPNTGPETVCISGHDVAHYSNDDGWEKKEVCDDYGVVYPGYQPSPNPTETAVVQN